MSKGTQVASDEFSRQRRRRINRKEKKHCEHTGTGFLERAGDVGIVGEGIREG